MEREAWETAFGLLQTMRPCSALALVTDGITNTPPEEQEVADAWLAIGQ